MNVASPQSRQLVPHRLISRKPHPRTTSSVDLVDVVVEEDSEVAAADVVATTITAMVDTEVMEAMAVATITARGTAVATITARAMVADMTTARAMEAMTTTLATLVMAIRVMETTEVVMIVATDMTTVTEVANKAVMARARQAPAGGQVGVAITLTAVNHE